MMVSRKRARYRPLIGRHRRIVEHALGLTPPRRRWSYRNHYCANIQDGIPPVIAEMVKEGTLMPGITINDGSDQYFHVTDRGINRSGLFPFIRREDRITWSPTRDLRIR